MATILYIEDNEAIRQLVRLILARRSDLELLEAENGSQGLTLAFGHLPDIILLDISLPDIDGNGVLKQLRSNPNTTATPVIAISGNSVIETQLTSPGFQGYLAKPIDIQALYTTIDSFLS